MKINTFSGRLAVFIGFLFLALTARAQPFTPPFLPPHYATALMVQDQPLRFVSQGEKQGINSALYKSVKGDVDVTVKLQACMRTVCDAIYDQVLKERNERLTSHGGQFHSVSFSEFTAEWKSGQKQNLIYVAKTPSTVTFWTTTFKVPHRLWGEEYLGSIRGVINQQRFNEAMQLGNVEVGRWAREIYQHGQHLLAQGKKEEALVVLSEVVAWSPSNFEAKLDFAEHTQDEAAASASALAVWENTESPALASRAAHLLGRTEPDASSSIPILERGVTGLQVVFIPLTPCDIRLLEEAAHLYSTSLDIPVQIARLPNSWHWEQADRLYRQRDMQFAISQSAGKAIDFTGWTMDRYAKELLAMTTKRDALARYQIHSFLEEAHGKPGQYRSDVYVERLLDILAPFRSNDGRTMFVGVTEADIFSGENNFLFSLAGAKNGLGASLLSYVRMQASMFNEPNQSRKRLIERLAKEMVPATLKLLGIPRPADPSDPYSYSDSVERLDQKTLTLSAPTREALNRFRSPEPQKGDRGNTGGWE